MKTITVDGPGFRVVFAIDRDHTRAVLQSTFKRSTNYVTGWTPGSTVSTSRKHVAETLHVARTRTDCTVGHCTCLPGQAPHEPGCALWSDR